MKGWQLIKIKKVTEEDGTLYVMENEKEIPFAIRRVFMIADVAEGRSRGDHATLSTRLILFPAAGSCRISVDDGNEKEEFLMDDASTGLLIEPMVWRSMYDFTSDCVLMAVCDRPFTPGRETVGDYDEFLKMKAEGKA